MVLTPEEVKVLEDELVKFGIVTVPQEQLFDNAKWWTDRRKVKVSDRIVVAMLWDPLTRTAPQAFDSDGNLRVNSKGPLKTDPVTAVGETATLTLTERLEIVGLHADASMAAVAETRNLNIRITVPVISSATPLAVVNSSTITLTTGQNGAFFFPSNHSHWTNDNGTVARVADENPFPMVFESGSAFQILSDNDQSLDSMSIELWYNLGGS